MSRYVCQLKFTVLGPFLLAGSGGMYYGLDKYFHRDGAGDPQIPASHIKGKLRTALAQLKPYFGEEMVAPDLDKWFGVGRDDSDNRDASYAPGAARSRFSDLICMSTVPKTEDGRPASHTRVTIDERTGTAKDRQLRQLEATFSSGAPSEWQGAISFFAENVTVANQIADTLRVGVRWIDALGGEKSSGYGRVIQATVNKAEAESLDQLPLPSLTSTGPLHLRITPLEPFLVGEVKSQRTNYIRSSPYFSGGLIKGALATGLNQAHHVEPSHRPLDGAYQDEFPGFEQLVAHFSTIRITHALPVLKADAPRPVRVPISAVEQNDDLVDTLLCEDAYPMLAGAAPRYFSDWKSKEHPRAYFGEAVPAYVYETRTEIDDKTGRARENRLFSYAFCQPRDTKGRDLEWIANVYFDQVPEIVRRQVKEQFAQAVRDYLRHLGKLQRSAQVQVLENPASNAMATRPVDSSDYLLVTLQSHAIMLRSEDVHDLAVGENLKQLYAEYWATLSTEDGRSPALVLDEFYAHQHYRGGYLYHRYLEPVEKAAGGARYRPYYLTGAGSVFKLHIEDMARAQVLIDSWTRHGLPLPPWATAEYGHPQHQIWQTCPFVPENGYGEIIVNLAWHWEQQLQKT